MTTLMDLAQTLIDLGWTVDTDYLDTAYVEELGYFEATQDREPFSGKTDMITVWTNGEIELESHWDGDGETTPFALDARTKPGVLAVIHYLETRS